MKNICIAYTHFCKERISDPQQIIFLLILIFVQTNLY